MSNWQRIERKVLTVLVYDLSPHTAFPFAPIMHRTRLQRRIVRRACRSLTRKGLAYFSNGLSTEDGEMVGSGYGATEQGRALIESEAA